MMAIIHLDDFVEFVKELVRGEPNLPSELSQGMNVSGTELIPLMNGKPRAVIAESRRNRRREMPACVMQATSTRRKIIKCPMAASSVADWKYAEADSVPAPH
jgi:hypothetical protein